MVSNCGINVDFPTHEEVNIEFAQLHNNIDLDYCGVEIPVSNVVFVQELPKVGDRDQLYVVNSSIYRWDNINLIFIPIAGEAFITWYFSDTLTTYVFAGGDCTVNLGILNKIKLL